MQRGGDRGDLLRDDAAERDAQQAPALADRVWDGHGKAASVGSDSG
jgi:hypothetical protein